MVQIIHSRVKGRIRCKVAGLFRFDALKQRLEAELGRHPAVVRISASTLTGNVLVVYRSDHNAKSIAILVASVAEGMAAERTAAAGAPPPPPRPRRSRLKKASARVARRVGGSLKAVVEKFERPARRHWHRLDRREVTAAQDSDDAAGLPPGEAERRLRRYGRNELPVSRQRTGWEIFFGQINSLPTFLLAAAAGVSAVTGGLVDAAVVLGVVAANAAIGYLTEREAEKTIHSLSTLVHPRAVVVRGRKTLEIDVAEVVPGDVLVLKPGSYVGADCRIVESRELTIDESMLTGESLPVNKHAKRLQREDVPLADRRNMAYMATQVTGGQGRAVAVATGRHTEIGGLQVLLQDTERPETPMERQLRVLGDQLVMMCGGICGIVFLLGFIRGYGILQMLRIAISLAAAAVPEGLPAAATMNFALGIRKMRRHRLIIRRLQAVETLGALQVVCLDKTGTITWNRMTVQQIYAGGVLFRHRRGRVEREERPVAAGEIPELMELIRVCVLCSEVKVRGNGDGDFTLEGSATENALVQMAISAGIDARELRRAHPLLNVRHRSERRLYMATSHRFNGRRGLLAVKGSPPEVLAMCTRQMVDGAIVPLEHRDRQVVEMQNARMAGAALRVLGLAFSVRDDAAAPAGGEELVWLGLVGMADPIREGVRELIGNFHRAGIETVMITGDQSPTAYTVARELDLSGDQLLEILDSSDLSALGDDALAALAGKANVYSRVTPVDKLKIVRALKAGGRTVAMTGDGINDGPALKAADIGIAMGRGGTDVAREVADVVIEDDRLETLILAVADGRGTYSNIRKSVHFFLSTNLSEIMVMFAAMAVGIGFPLNVMQLLWINIISDIFPGLALSLETPEPDVMERKPREAAAPLFSRRDFQEMARESAVISASTLGAYAAGIARHGMGGANAATMAFHSLTVGQLLHAYACRSAGHGIFSRASMPANPYLNAAIGGSLLLQALTLFVPPLRRLLGLGSLTAGEMAMVGGFSTLPLLINEFIKERRTNHA